MNKKQIAKSNSFAKLEVILNENTSLVTGYKALNNAIGAFMATKNEIEKISMVSVAGRQGAGDGKSDKQKQMVILAVNLARKGLVWAKENNKLSAVEIYDVYKTDFDRASSTVCVAMAKNIAEQLNIDLSNLKDYRIAAENITALNNAIAAFETESPMPILKRKKTAEANRQLKELYAKADGLVGNIVDLIKGEYDTSHPEFVNMVMSAKAIDDIGGRSTKLIVTVIDAEGKPIAEVLGDVLEMVDEEDYTDEKGELTIEGIKNGAYNLELTKGGLKHIEKFSIKQGEQLKLKIVLK
jgi:hypothetical protein